MMAERFLDALGLPFADVQVPDRHASVKIVKDRKALEAYAAQWDHCQICGRRTVVYRHHLVGGARRSDEATNLLMLCSWGGCHEVIQHSLDFAGVVLHQKWWLDRSNLSWQRLRELKGSRLAELVVDPSTIRLYRDNQGL